MARKKSTPAPAEEQEVLQTTEADTPILDEATEHPDSNQDDGVFNSNEATYPTEDSDAPLDGGFPTDTPKDQPEVETDTSGSTGAEEEITSSEVTQDVLSKEDGPDGDAYPEEEPLLEDSVPSETGSDDPVGGDDYASLLHDFAAMEPGGDDHELQDSSDVPSGSLADAYGTDDFLPTGDDAPLGADDDDVTPETEGPSTAPVERPQARDAASARRRERILTIDARDEIQTDSERAAIIWHDIQNSHRTRRILTGTLDGVEKTESGLTLAVVNYRGMRVAIPVKEMLLYTGEDAPSGREFMDSLHRILSSRLGAEIDFIVKGYDNETRSVVASRKEAMYRKRQIFYMERDEFGEYMIYEGRVVQARVVAVAEKLIRVEVFGVETSIVARGLSWEWIGDARDYYSVGDRVLVRVQRISRPNVKNLSIRADIRSVSTATSRDNLSKCIPQSRYAGTVTDIRNGVVFVRLNNGVNAIAHSCYDTRYPGKKDAVSFVVTRLDEERGVATGIITRIIKQNL